MSAIPQYSEMLKKLGSFTRVERRWLGNQFIDEFERQILRIAVMPGRWSIVAGDLRRSLMSRFPYVIYFRQPNSDRLRITVVKHQRRHPVYGLARK